MRPALTIDDGRVAVTDNCLRVAVALGHARNEWIDVAVPAIDGPPAADHADTEIRTAEASATTP